MEKVLCVMFLVSWCVFWGYVLLTRPDTFFRFNQMGRDNLKAAGGAATKGAVFAARLLK